MHDVQPLISVIIPCYNQAHFLSAAIDSVLAQTYAQYEIVVVDDGSTDDTARIAARYPTVRYIRQENQGLSSARNTGLRESRGAYLVFLDADDLLLPHALEAGLTCFCAHPDCAFVSGHYHYMNQNGSCRRDTPRAYIERDHYLALLQGNYIGMHATVMYRRDVFAEVGDYNTALPACEDYDLYLRLARRFPVYCHDEVVAAYRQHGNNMSGDLRLMLKTALAVLRSQRPSIKGDRQATQSMRTGIHNWQAHYGELLFSKAASLKLTRNFRPKVQTLLAVLRYAPRYFGHYALKRLLQIGMAGLRTVLPNALRDYIAQRVYAFPWPPVGRIDFGDLRQIRPLPETAQPATGMRIDQYYVESFLNRQAHDIHGRVLELNSTDYTGRFGCKRVAVSDICRLVKQATDSASEADLTLADAMPANLYDCIIFPQALHRVYDVEAMVQALYDRLQPGGVLLVTVPGMGLVTDGDSDHTGYWAFTELAVQQLFTRVFGEHQINVRAYGNVFAATAFYHNLSVNELSQAERDHYDEQFQLLVSVRAIKCCAARPSPSGFKVENP